MVTARIVNCNSLQATHLPAGSNIHLPTQDQRILREIEEESATVNVRGSAIAIGEGAVVALMVHPERHRVVVLAMSILEILETLVDAIDVAALKRMEETSDTPLGNASERGSAPLAPATIAGKSLEHLTVGQRLETTIEWLVPVNGRKRGREAEETLKSTGQFPLPEMNVWRWICLVLAILALTLVNMRISQLTLLETTYLHTSHL